MMKQYTFWLVLLSLGSSGLTAEAQRVAAPVLRTAAPPARAVHPGIATGQLRSDPIWSDDFSVPSHWTFGTLAGTAHNWVIGTTPPTGSYAIDTIHSTTAANGFALFDSDLLCGPDNGYLAIASPVDLSAVPHVQLQFEQYYRRFQGQTFVDVSHDGATWTSIEVNSQLITGAYTANPALTSVDITAVAGNQPTVWFRFRYVGNCDYAWMVDDVALVEQPAHELALVSASTTTWNFNTNLTFDSVYYSIFPITELRPLAVNLTVFNAGYEPATNVMAHITTSDGYDHSGNMGTLQPGDTATWFGPLWLPSAVVGAHSVLFTTTMDAAEDTTDNAASMVIGVDDGGGPGDGDPMYFMMARDNGVREFEVGDGDQAYLVGNWFHLRNDHYATGIKVAMSSTSASGVEVNGQIMDGSRQLLAETYYHTVMPADLNAVGGSNFIQLIFDPPVQLHGGNDYFVALKHYGGVPMWVGSSGISAEQSSLLYREANDTWYSISPTPMVRLLVDWYGGIGELAPGSLGLGAWPNPADGSTRVEYQLERPAMVELFLCDLHGRDVRKLSSGLTTAGKHQVDVDTRGLPGGVYSVVLQSAAGRSTQRLVVMH